MIWRLLFLALVYGALSVLAFAPFEQSWLMVACLVGLLVLLHKATVSNAFKLGLAYGTGLFLSGVSWVYVSLTTYGGMPLWMGVLAVFGFAVLMAMFIAVACAGLAWMTRPGTSARLLLFPFVWCVMEWSKSWVLTGFPWLDVGYSQTNTWLMGWASIGAIYLVGFVVCCLVVCLCYSIIRKDWRASVVAVLILAASWLVNHLSWTAPLGTPLAVGVAQGNIPIEGKWQPGNQADTIRRYQSLSNELLQQGELDLLIWPETAMPFAAQQADDTFWRSLVSPKTALLTGLLSYEADFVYNAALLSCAGTSSGPILYRKRHLVPFGEYTPLQSIFGWVIDYLKLPQSDMRSWHDEQLALECGNQIRLGLSICYEDAFAAEYRAHLNQGAILVNISEDAWFGDSLAPHQRRQMAQMRARELGRPMVRSANSGPSLFIDHHGNVVAETEQFIATSVRKMVQRMQGQTPYMQLGNWIVWLSLLCLLLYVAFTRVVARR